MHLEGTHLRPGQRRAQGGDARRNPADQGDPDGTSGSRHHWRSRSKGSEIASQTFMTASRPDLIVLYEHPEWQKPLFAALERRGVSFEPFDVTRAAFTNVDVLRAPLYFNQASPSAYVRGNKIGRAHV